MKRNAYLQPTTPRFIMFALYLLKRFLWRTVQRRKNPIVKSDNYQVTLTVIRKKTVHIIKANVRSVAFSCHTGEQPSSPLVDCLVEDMLLQTRQQSGPTSDLRAVRMFLYDTHTL